MNGGSMNTKQKLDFIRQNLYSLTDRELGERLGLSKDSLRSFRKKHGVNRNPQFSKDLLKQGFDGENWSHGWLKTDTSSIFIRNDEGVMTYKDIRDELISEMKKHAPKYPTLNRQKITGGHCLIIDPADIHVGKLSLKGETGREYNIQVAKQRAIEGVKAILHKAQGFPVDKIIFVMGNDVLHVDNPFRTTTSGTKQDTDGMWWQAFQEAKDMYVAILEMLIPIADVEVVFCPSNHDYASGFMLADSLSSWFHNCKHITFYTDIIHRKYIKYGANLFGFDHGDGAKERDTKDLMADEAPQLWGETKFRYSFKHHIHHSKKVNWVSGQDFIGLTVIYLRSPSEPDGWHARNGYLNRPAIEGFCVSKENGLVASLTHYF